MECEKIRPLLEDFADGELVSPDKEALEEHLRTCSACQEELSAIRRTIRLLAEFGQVDEPADFLARVRGKIEARRRGAFEWSLARPVLTRVLVPVACVLVAGVGIWMAIEQVTPPSPPAARRGVEVSRKPGTAGREYREAEDIGTGESRLRAAGAFKADAKGGAFEELQEKVEARRFAAPERPRVGAEVEKAEETLSMKDMTGAVPAKAKYANAEETAPGKAGSASAPERHNKLGSAIENGRAEGKEHAGAEAAGRRWADEERAEREERYPAEKAAAKREAAPTQEVNQLARRTARAKAAEEVLSGRVPPVPTTPAPPGGPPAAEPLAEKAARGTDVASHEFQRALPKGEEKPAKGPGPSLEAQAEPVERVAEEDGDLGLWEAREEQRAVIGAELKLSQEKKNQPVLPAFGNHLSLDLSKAVGLKEGMSGRPQAQTLNGTGAAGFIRGELTAGNLYGASWGTVPELVLTVVERKKAIAEITKAVTELGGAVEFPVRRGSVLRTRAEIAEAAWIVVQLDNESYRRFQEKFALAPGTARGTGTESGLLQHDVAGKPNAEQKETSSGDYFYRSLDTTGQAVAAPEGIVTFLIRLVEVPQAGEAQQAPAK